VVVCPTHAKRSVGVITAVGPLDPRHVNYTEVTVRWQNGTTSKATLYRLFDYDSVIAGINAKLQEAAMRRARAADTLTPRD